MIYYSMSQRLERTCLRNWIVLPLLLVFLFFVTDFPSLALPQSTDVNIIDLVYETGEISKDTAAAYKDGFCASLWSRNFTPANRKVNIIAMKPPPPNEVSSRIVEKVGESEDLFVVLGPSSTEHTKGALDALNKTDVVALCPFTIALSLRKFEKHLYFFLIHTAIATYTLLRHAVINMRVRRIAVMYTTDISFGADEYNLLIRLLEEVNMKFCGIFKIDANANYAEDKETNRGWEKFVESRPQVVIVLGLKNRGTVVFIDMLLRDSRTSSTDLMFTFVDPTILDLWEKALADERCNYNGQMFTISSFPDYFGNESAMVKKSRSIIDAYFEDRVKEKKDKEKRVAGGWGDRSGTLAGWVAGEILYQALARFNPALNRTQFIASLYKQRTYVIEEFIIGIYGDKVNEAVKRSGAIDSCNEGSTAAYLRQYHDPKNSTSIPEGDYVFPIYICHRDEMKLVDSAAIVTVNFTDVNDVISSNFNETKNGQEAGISFLKSEPKHDMTVKVLQTTYNTVARTLQKEKANKWTNIVIGMVDEATLDISNLTFIDPKVKVDRMNKFRRNVIFLSPTVEQQLFLLAEYVASLRDRTLHAILRGEAAHEALEVLRRSLLTFRVTLSSHVLLPNLGAIENKLEAGGITVLFGAGAADIPSLVAHLERNKNARLVVLFNPFALFYKEFYTAFKGKQAAERLLLITNLPHWADRKSKSKMIRSFHERVEDPLPWSPASLQSFIVGRFIREVVDDLKLVTWSSVANYFYSSVVVRLDDMTFGPYSDNTSVTCASTSDPESLDCAKNFGATSISIWPMSRVYDPNVGVLFGPVTPSMKYRLSTGLTRAQQIGIIVGCLLGAAVVAAVLGLMFFKFCNGNFSALKDPEHPVTLIFTDIQSSTAMWAELPDIMADAVETHHRLIRRLIAKYKCYEVKTVGDSFMIACKSPYAAVKLVDDLQRTFLHHDWGTSAFDEVYRVLEEAQAEEDDADYKSPTARLDDAVYRELWNGLRVRAGVHTGLSDIRYDAVTKRYDYYGSTSNTTARTESIANGGQVLLTRATYMALSTAERAGLNVTALGAVELRGVPEPVGMLQLNPVPGRTFPALRLEKGNDECDFATGSVADTEASGSEGEVLSPAAEKVFGILHDMFTPFPLQQRLKCLEPLCKRWSVMMPVARNPRELLGVVLLAEQRLAMRVSRVAEHRQLTPDCITGASETISSARGRLLVQDLSRGSSFIENWFSRPTAFASYQGSERQRKTPYASVHVYRGSPLLSSGSTIEVGENTFPDIN